MSQSIRDLLDRHEPLVAQQTADPRYVAIKKEELKELWELAHDAVHPPENDEDDEPTIERGYDSTQLRMQCLQLAQQYEINKMHALDDVAPTDPVMLAEAYLHFLKGGEDVPGQ